MLVAANIFQPLISVFQSVLVFFNHNLGIPWGWAIVLLTICVRLCLVPLMLRQFHSMQALQRLQPEMKALQAKYKDDKQRQQQELMKFYKENNVNPLGSCLPMVAQLPVFISLFYMLRKSLLKDICPGTQLRYQAHYAAVHHISLHAAAGQTTPCGPGPASFLFIPDLTNTATGAVLVVLLILYVGTQLASSLLMATPTMDPTQRKMMLVLPLVFVLFIIRFPAGVIVYWITTNTWTMGQQYVFRRRIGSLRPVTPAGGSGPGSGGGGPGGSGSDGPSGGNGSGPDDRNGGGSSGGLGALLRNARGKSAEDDEATPVGGGKSGSGKSGSSSSGGGGTPPPPPRKRKKRSGRRR